jgi:hypothetical protein
MQTQGLSCAMMCNTSSASTSFLTQGEEMFGTVISHQRLCDCFLAGFDAIIAQAGELERVPLSVKNGIEDGDAAYSGDIADDMVCSCRFIWSNAF